MGQVPIKLLGRSHHSCTGAGCCDTEHSPATSQNQSSREASQPHPTLVIRHHTCHVSRVTCRVLQARDGEFVGGLVGEAEDCGQQQHHGGQRAQGRHQPQVGCKQDVMDRELSNVESLKRRFTRWFVIMERAFPWLKAPTSY